MGKNEISSKRIRNIFIAILSVAFACYHFYTAWFGALEGFQQGIVHLLFIMLLGYIYFPKISNKSNKYLDIAANALLCGGSIYTLIHCLVNFKYILSRMAGVTKVTTYEIIIGSILALAVLELARRALGWAMPTLAIIFCTYALLSNNLSGVLWHRGLSFERLIEWLFMSNMGIFGEALTISSTFVALFVIFGAFLEVSGGGRFFIQIAKSLVGRISGGPGLMSVVASALMGMISGSAVANVTSTGVFTIPLMKSTGYEKNYAGAVEAVASSGGQILPPVMGAGAFLMAEFLGIPYSQIIIYAAVPAILYFFAVFVQVYLTAKKEKMKGLDKSEIGSFWSIVKKEGYLVIPPIVMVWTLMAGFSASRAALWGCVSVLIVSMFRKETRMTPKRIMKGCIDFGRSMAPVAIACACAGIIICVIRTTGVALKFSSATLSVADGNLIIALIMVMISAIIMGMGIPVTASYIILASLACPALLELGLMPIQAHLFAFYFAGFAGITPPVALAAYAAAPICGGNPMIVGIKAFKLGLAAFIVPFAFAYGPGLLFIGTTGEIILSIISALIGVTFMSIALTGWLFKNIRLPLRILIFIGSLLSIIQGLTTDIIGYVIIAAALLLHRFLSKKEDMRVAV